MTPYSATSRTAILSPELEAVILSSVIVYAVVDDALSPDFPLGVELEVVIRREDAERFVEEVRGDEPDMAAKLRIRGARARGWWAELGGSSFARSRFRG